MQHTLKGQEHGVRSSAVAGLALTNACTCRFRRDGGEESHLISARVCKPDSSENTIQLCI